MLSRIYLYVFVALFIYAVLNIFIAILEDAFVTSTLSMERRAKAAKTAIDASRQELAAAAGMHRTDSVTVGHDSDDDEAHARAQMQAFNIQEADTNEQSPDEMLARLLYALVGLARHVPC